ncbi:MAG: glycosyltransferase family 1 protein [Phycisphaeraceae bacterium]|nr:glycosyltransferase family 1 protein [Phycisphaeraceae bacterium]MCB9847775.1 glycosyltransferase family 1 protein [Phycisphaeraceae bacterium]
MRITLYTDTLGDVSGVCRFIQDMARIARETGRDLTVVTSTAKPIPDEPNLVNFPPLIARSMPRYPDLDIVAPPVVSMLQHAMHRRADVVHTSTPGPVGLSGRLAATLGGAPVCGVYHTDFPAYLEDLYHSRFMGWATSQAMRAFYAGIRRVFSRSEEYVSALTKIGVPRERIVALRPGVETATFRPEFRDDSVWSTVEGARPGAVKALYCGRVSTEKNLPMLVGAWKSAHARLSSSGVETQLIVVGGGPYLERMRAELDDGSAAFAGYRHGAELSALYASCDLFAFPSATDTLGQVVLEAQASGVPVLVSDQGGPRQVVGDGVTGLVLPAFEQGPWEDALVALLRGADRRIAMGAAAHPWAQRFSIRESFEHFWKTHEQALLTR